jgi:hypothetical protein
LTPLEAWRYCRSVRAPMEIAPETSLDQVGWPLSVGRAGEAERRIRDVFTNGPVYEKLFSLRYRHPELSAEVDDILRAVSRSLTEISLLALDEADSDGG